jgi:membrane-bound lytic murein transglycosylase D
MNLSRVQLAQFFLAGVLVATLLLSGCASSSSGSSAASQVSVTYEKSEGQTGEVESATEPVADSAIAQLDEEEESVPDLEDEDSPSARESPTSSTAGYSDPALLLEESLEAFESSKVFWEQGNFDDAFAALDRSYELMAEVPPNGDPYIAQQKEDLRHLISRRITEIYASRQTTVGDMTGAIPLVMNEYVEREIKSFQGPERTFFLESYQRSGLYRDMIVEELRAAGLPEQISWLPLVESGFKSRALSRARALGLWQFISSTGYRYGLQRDWWIDERMDPHKATLGAIGYLTDLHNLFGDWYLALAGYNCGEHNVLKAIKRQSEGYFDQFWDIYGRLPRETRRYVPRLLAVLTILEDPAAYGFDLPEPFPPLTWETVEIERSAELSALDKSMDLSSGTLATLNPELRRQATPADPYELKIPTGQTATLMASLATLPEWEAPVNTFSVHRVRRGETLSGIASRYGTNVRTLMEANNLRSANRIWPGQQLQVPDGRSGSSSTTRSASALAPGSEMAYSVRRGDSLWIIANRYGTTVERIKRDNSLRSSTLHPGQTLILRGSGAAASASGGTYVVRRGDTLGKIAQNQGISLNRLMSANGLSRRSTIHPGQRLVIPN